MKYKKLIIVDLEKDLNLNYDNALYVYLNSGKISFKDSKRLYLESIRKKNFFKIKRSIIKILIDKVNKNKKILDLFPELNFFNLRNDKDRGYDLLINLLLIKKYKKLKKIKETIVLTDNELTKNFFSEYDDKVFYFNNRFNFKFKLYRVKIIKFFIKSFFVILLSKLLSRNINHNKNYNDASITLFPFFFEKNKENFYLKKNDLKINFLMGDETHIKNCTILTIIKNLIKNKTKNLINIETMVSFKDLFNSYKKAILNLKLINKIDLNLILENHNFGDFYKNNLNISIINRSKLEIYNKAIKKISYKYKIKKINLYLFEYSFGFYLIKQFKRYTKNIKIIAYQHGIFYKKLPWLEIITNIKFKKDYYPDYICAFNKEMIIHYKSVFKNKKIEYILKPKKISEVAKRIVYNSKSKNILIILGAKDTHEIIKILSDHTNNSYNDRFNYFIKPHPKRKITLDKNSKLQKIKNVNNIYFNKVIISPTSTIVYDMKKLKKPFYIFDIDYKFRFIPNVNQFHI